MLTDRPNRFCSRNLKIEEPSLILKKLLQSRFKNIAEVSQMNKQMEMAPYEKRFIIKDSGMTKDPVSPANTKWIYGWI